MTAMISGSNPTMILGKGLATLLTASFTVPQYKMLGVISETLAVRKQLFKEAGVANLEQYGTLHLDARP
ncbi:hypothetical protein G7067_07015 [Leucobacter insecticola]|uniref:Uncharacterized protein n=1 Tax=Leucobacter insecticola TaxID=2714934 RepID=A0A6G8FFM4_9MICO|nr:hypothetical protein [Leucobacter insecticola]QIM15161.1 hypothetical protein G7067_07015 [Leucobacter insecticola]